MSSKKFSSPDLIDNVALPQHKTTLKNAIYDAFLS